MSVVVSGQEEAVSPLYVLKCTLTCCSAVSASQMGIAAERQYIACV